MSRPRNKSLSISKQLSALASLARSFDIIDRYMEMRLSQYNATLTQFSIMNTLCRHNGRMKPTDISKKIYRTSHTVSAVIDTLEKAGEVKRERSIIDRRSVDVVITQAGWDKTQLILAEAEKISNEVFSCLEEAEIEELQNSMKRIREDVLTKIAHFVNSNQRQNQKPVDIPDMQSEDID